MAIPVQARIGRRTVDAPILNFNLISCRQNETFVVLSVGTQLRSGTDDIHRDFQIGCKSDKR
jgi:hypothetical protein